MQTKTTIAQGEKLTFDDTNKKSFFFVNNVLINQTILDSLFYLQSRFPDEPLFLNTGKLNILADISDLFTYAIVQSDYLVDDEKVKQVLSTIAYLQELIVKLSIPADSYSEVNKAFMLKI